MKYLIQLVSETLTKKCRDFRRGYKIAFLTELLQTTAVITHTRLIQSDIHELGKRDPATCLVAGLFYAFGQPPAALLCLSIGFCKCLNFTILQRYNHIEIYESIGATK